MRTSKLIERSGVLPVVLAEVKNHLGIYHTEKDDYLDILIDAATNIAEKFTGQIFRGATTFEQSVDSFGSVELDYSPTLEIVSVKYSDSSNTEQTLSTDLYQFIDYSTPQFVKFDTGLPSLYNRDDAVRITYKAGYSNPYDVSADVKSAILLIVQNLYDNPGDSIRQMPTTSEYILRNHKVK